MAHAEIASARAAADASNAATRSNLEATVAATDQAAAVTIAQKQAAIGAAVRRLVAEKLSARQVVQLTELTPAQVRNVVRQAGPTAAVLREADGAGPLRSRGADS